MAAFQRHSMAKEPIEGKGTVAVILKKNFILYLSKILNSLLLLFSLSFQSFYKRCRRDILFQGCQELLWSVPCLQNSPRSWANKALKGFKSQLSLSQQKHEASGNTSGCLYSGYTPPGANSTIFFCPGSTRGIRTYL